MVAIEELRLYPCMRHQYPSLEATMRMHYYAASNGNNPEECSFRLLRGGSLKSRISILYCAHEL
jgi:hypothetical protein